MALQIAPPGLRGLAVADTALGSVRGEEGFFHYRQYDAAELARRRTLEDVWTLQVDGGLPPTVATIDPGPLRFLPSEAAVVVDAAAAHLDDPMAVLRVPLREEGVLGEKVHLAVKQRGNLVRPENLDDVELDAEV